MTPDERQAAQVAERVEAAQRSERLYALAEAADDPEERERLLGAAAEAEGMSLNGAGFSRPQG